MTDIERSTPDRLSATVAGSGPGLLLAHGATGSVEGNFSGLIEAFAPSRTVVAADYPGSGATPRAAGPLDLDDLAGRLVAAADDAGLERFALRGFSMGTQVAVRAAALYPERVDALVLSAGLARLSEANRKVIEDWRAEVAGAAEPNLGELAQIDLLLRNDTSADLSRIAAPTLVVKTLRDDLVLPENSDELAAGIPGARVAELDSGHLIWEDDFDGWIRAVRGFLDGLPG